MKIFIHKSRSKPSMCRRRLLNQNVFSIYFNFNSSSFFSFFFFFQEDNHQVIEDCDLLGRYGLCLALIRAWLSVLSLPLSPQCLVSVLSSSSDSCGCQGSAAASRLLSAEQSGDSAPFCCACRLTLQHHDPDLRLAPRTAKT